MNKSEIKIYQTEDGTTEISVKLADDTVWLSLAQMTELFGRDKSVISRHINNIFKEGELERISVVAKNATTASDGKTYLVEFYNLDVIISVGYRVKSKHGTQFRIWANKILKEYLFQGYVIDKRRIEAQNERLQELKESVKILGEIVDQKELTTDESTGLLRLISDYARALDLLDKYDYQNLEIDFPLHKETYRINYAEAIEQVKRAKAFQSNTPLFGQEKDQSFQSSISTIYQTFNGQDLYPSTEEKAANLLYLVTKNHSFVDGNKRIAALLFLYFLDKNNILFNERGTKKINDSTLVSLTIMIAVSKPEEKETMIKVIVNLMNNE